MCLLQFYRSLPCAPVCTVLTLLRVLTVHYNRLYTDGRCDIIRLTEWAAWVTCSDDALISLNFEMHKKMLSVAKLLWPRSETQATP